MLFLTDLTEKENISQTASNAAMRYH